MRREMISELSEIVRAVGQRLLEWRDQGITEGKWEGSQFKARADMLSHNMLVQKLKQLTPGMLVISEEDPRSLLAERPDRYWLIDPIDGTASFVQGYPGFVTQVALIERERPQLAAVYGPALKCLYLAVRGQGAFLNGKRLRCIQNQEPAVLIDNYPEPRGTALLAYEALNLDRYIECGSISLKACKVADGAADVFFKDIVVRDWDLAAPQLVLEEAGGTLLDIYGRDVVYTGSHERAGVVAACSDAIARRLVSWYADLTMHGGNV